MDFKKFTLIAGPCLIEGRDMLRQTAEKLLGATKDRDVNFIFKASYRKANRTSDGSFSGIGDEAAIKLLVDIKREFSLPILTDFHSVREIEDYSNDIDIIQIPAFLARQTDIIEAAAKTGKVLNIKKAQFMAPEDAIKAAKKAINSGNPNVLITERGTCFGYHDLVVDFRAISIMKQSGLPIIYDATHSLQQPSIGQESGGKREFLFPLAKAAIAVGVNGVFFETHPNPSEAKSDSATQIPLENAESFINEIHQLYNYINAI